MHRFVRVESPAQSPPDSWTDADGCPVRTHARCRQRPRVPAELLLERPATPPLASREACPSERPVLPQGIRRRPRPLGGGPVRLAPPRWVVDPVESVWPRIRGAASRATGSHRTGHRERDSGSAHLALRRSLVNRNGSSGWQQRRMEVEAGRLVVQPAERKRLFPRHG